MRDLSAELTWVATWPLQFFSQRWGENRKCTVTEGVIWVAVQNVSHFTQTGLPSFVIYISETWKELPFLCNISAALPSPFMEGKDEQQRPHEH